MIRDRFDNLRIVYNFGCVTSESVRRYPSAVERGASITLNHVLVDYLTAY